MLFVAASQGGGKTEILLNACGHFIDADPSPQILVTYSVEMAESLSKHRVAPMLRETPTLREKVAEAKSRDSANTIRDKQYPGGSLTLVGANSAGGLSMHPKRVALFDEIDRYPPSAGTEGDPVALAETRTEAFWNAVKVYATSPGVKKRSRSWLLWERSDQREWFVPCADCGHEQVLKWSQVHWDKDDRGEPLPETAVYACERCGSAWDDVARWKASEAGRYVAQKAHRGIAGFRVSRLAVVNKPLASIVEQWLAAQGDPEQLKVFVNTALAEWWEERGRSPASESIAARPRIEVVDGASEPMVPAVAIVGTSFTDVQLDRLETGIEWWGVGEENWKTEYHVLYGDPTAEPVWQSLWELLNRPRRSERGIDMFVRSSAIDSGYAAQSVYAFVRTRPVYYTSDQRIAYLWATKGVPGTGNVWPTRASVNTIGQCPIYPVKIDTAKDQVAARLEIRTPGPGYSHFSAVFDEDYFRKLASEHAVDSRDRKGFPVRTWKMKDGHKRNEPWDVAVGNYAALCALYSVGFNFDDEAAYLDSRTPRSAGVAAPAAPPATTPEPPRRARGGWIEAGPDWLRR